MLLILDEFDMLRLCSLLVEVILVEGEFILETAVEGGVERLFEFGGGGFEGGVELLGGIEELFEIYLHLHYRY